MTELLTHLAPDTRTTVETYLDKLETALSSMRVSERQDALDDAEEFFAERLTADSTPADAALVADELGDPQVFAANMLGALGRRPRRTAGPASADDDAGASGRARIGALGSGTILGLPYDVRIPTASRVASRWWDPTNPRVFVPRVWGIGWDVNFGAVAVLLRLFRPDDEDVPFEPVPRRALVISLLIPVALTALIAGVAIAFGDRLPADLPSHWNLKGEPDQFWSAGAVLAFSLAMAGVPTAYAVFCVMADRSRLQQAATIALACFLSVVGAGIYVQAVLWSLGRDVSYFMIPLLVVAVVLPFAVLTILARRGRAQEWRRELPSASRREL